jgi:hypothetical protein
MSSVMMTKITKAETYERPAIGIRVAIAIGIAIGIIIVLIVVVTGSAVPVPDLVTVVPTIFPAAVPPMHLLNEPSFNTGRLPFVSPPASGLAALGPAAKARPLIATAAANKGSFLIEFLL